MDRFTGGFVAGLIAAVVQAITNYALFYLNLTELLWSSFASVMIYGRTSMSLGEQVFAELGAWFFCGLMGVLLAFLMARIGSRNHLFKGFVFGEFVWFSSFAITLLFKVPEFEIITLKTAISNFVSAGIWGTVAAEVLRRYDSSGLKNP